MESYRAIPPGYLTVGEVAKKMGVTPRALQYYDREGLLSPSAHSEGGRRLYTDKDIVKLHQILSLKRLGFSLDDIRDRLIPLETPAEVAGVLAEQAVAVKEKIDALSESLREITALRDEVLRMESVDFHKYADIIINLQMKNEFYWMITGFDDQMLAHIRSRFDMDSGLLFIQKFHRLQEEAIALKREGADAAGGRGQAFAKRYWDMILEFTGGDMSLLQPLMKFGQSELADPAWKERQDDANAFIGPALDAYFAGSGVNPFPKEVE